MERSLALEPISMERAVASLKWKTTASAACSPGETRPPLLYGRYRFADGLENRLQFMLGGGWADYLGVFSATLTCWLFIRAPSALADDLYLPTPRILPLHASTRRGRWERKGRPWQKLPAVLSVVRRIRAASWTV